MRDKIFNTVNVRVIISTLSYKKKSYKYLISICLPQLQIHTLYVKKYKGLFFLIRCIDFLIGIITYILIIILFL